MNSDNYSEMRAQIEEDHKTALSQLDAEKTRRLSLLDEIFAPWLRTSNSPVIEHSASLLSPEKTAENSNPPVTELDDDGINLGDSMRARTRAVIEEMDANKDVFMRRVYKLLLEKNPDMLELKQENVRSQVSTVLGKLHKKGYLRIVKKGSGGVPNVYRKVKNEGNNSQSNGNGVAATTATPSMFSSNETKEEYK